MTVTKASPSNPSSRVDPSTSVKSSVTIRGACIRGARAPREVDHTLTVTGKALALIPSACP